MTVQIVVGDDTFFHNGDWEVVGSAVQKGWKLRDKYMAAY
jgi:hypothetical protein